MKKFNVAQRELIFKYNKTMKNKKILNISIGKNNDDCINKNKIKYNNIGKLEYKINDCYDVTQIFNENFVKMNKKS
jgi:hypothetical protein